MKKKKFIEEMMHSGLWEDRACSEKAREKAIQEANKLYDAHFAESKTKINELYHEIAKIKRKNEKLQYLVDNPYLLDNKTAFKPTATPIRSN